MQSKRGVLAFAILLLLVGCSDDDRNPVGVQSATLGPVIFSIQPSAAEPGQAVTIFGDRFGNSATGLAVSFDGQAAAINARSTTAIVATVPANATPGQKELKVTVAGRSAVTTITILPASSDGGGTGGGDGTGGGTGGDGTGGGGTGGDGSGGGTDGGGSGGGTGGGDGGGSGGGGSAAPVITGVTPSPIVAGEDFRIDGSGFGSNASDVEVRLDGQEATVRAVTDTRIEATAPGNVSGDATLTVKVNGRTSDPFPVTVVPNVEGTYTTEATVVSNACGADVSAFVDAMDDGTATVVQDGPAATFSMEGGGTYQDDQLEADGSFFAENGDDDVDLDFGEGAFTGTLTRDLPLCSVTFALTGTRR
jgi:hypothetical protein